MGKTANLVLSRLDVLKVPHEFSIPFSYQIEKWCDNSGPEWTVQRLKSIKLDFINDIGHRPRSSSWIAYKGPLKGFMNWGIRKKNRYRMIQALNAYTQFIASKITKSQIAKFESGVLGKPINTPGYLKDLVIKGANKMGIFLHPKDPKPLLMYPCSSSRKMPHPAGFSVSEDPFLLESLYHLRSTRIGWDIEGSFRDIFKYVTSGLEYVDDRDHPDILDYDNSVGSIGFIQEPGFKLRAIANPSRVYQVALEPLGTEIYRSLKRLPWDCTFDQSKGFLIIQKQLQLGHKAFSVDLSNATDLFPLDIQISLLRSISSRVDYVNLFEMISRMPWKYGKSTIQWTKGQPLGLFPSFGSFALTHGLLLYGLNNLSYDGEFFILGDDVVILDEQLYNRYTSVLTELECPISVSKSIISDSIAEFGGKLITQESIIDQFKWRLPSDDNFIDITRNLGIRGLSILRSRQRKIAKLLIDVPDFMGGLGFNPDGIPLSDRVFKALSILDSKDNTAYLTGYNRKLNSLFWSTSKFQGPVYVRLAPDSTGDFDQKSITIIRNLIPHFVRFYEIMGKNLYSIDPTLDLQIQGVSGRLSLLERLSKTLL